MRLTISLISPRFFLVGLATLVVVGCNALPNRPPAETLLLTPAPSAAAPAQVPGNLSRESYLLILDCYLARLPRNDPSRANLAGHEAQVLSLDEAQFCAVFSSEASRLSVERNKELAAGLGCTAATGPSSPAQLSAAQNG